MRMNKCFHWLRVSALALGLTLGAGFLGTGAAFAGAPDGFSDGTIPIALHADDLVTTTSGAGDKGAVRSLALAEAITIDGMLDETLLEPQDSLLSCLSADDESLGEFTTSARSTVAIVAICRSTAGEWTIAGADGVSGDRYVLKGEVGIASDGTIAFSGTAFRELAAGAKPQSLGKFRLVN